MRRQIAHFRNISLDADEARKFYIHRQWTVITTAIRCQNDEHHSQGLLFNTLRSAFIPRSFLFPSSWILELIPGFPRLSLKPVSVSTYLLLSSSGKNIISPRWFGRDEVSPGAIVELEHRWLVLSQKEEHAFQGSETDDPKWSGPSYAWIQLKVRQVGSKPPVNGYMRVYKQISTKETVADRPEVRARQAQALVPPELKAYRQLTRHGSTFIPKLLDSLEGRQNTYECVPGGFVVWIVTEQVPGVRLGNSVSDETFWSMEPSVRAEIRASFMEGYLKMLRWGWLPLYNCCGDLVWDADSSTVYFVNWFMAVQVVTPLGSSRFPSPTTFGSHFVAMMGAQKVGSGEECGALI